MDNQKTHTTRRNFLGATVSLAAAPLFVPTQSSADVKNSGVKHSNKSDTSRRRKLNTLEVSSVGLGVQNMHRTYQTTIPRRSDMIDIIRAAYDDITFLIQQKPMVRLNVNVY